MKTREQSAGEEIANAVTHGIGLALSVAGLVLLVGSAATRGDALRVTTLAIFGSALIVAYGASTLYHAFRHPTAKRVFRILDHASIYLLIAATYTPVALIVLRGAWGWSIFGAIWLLAVTGVVAKVFLTGKMGAASVALYLGMGWLVVVAAVPLLRAAPSGLILWLVLGGLCYSLGTVFYGWKRLPYHHAIWHLFVLGGSICHFFGMLFHLAPATA